MKTFWRRYSFKQVVMQVLLLLRAFLILFGAFVFFMGFVSLTLPTSDGVPPDVNQALNVGSIGYGLLLVLSPKWLLQRWPVLLSLLVLTYRMYWGQHQLHPQEDQASHLIFFAPLAIPWVLTVLGIKELSLKSFGFQKRGVDVA